MGMILVASVFYFFRIYAFSSKISFRFWPFSNPTVVNEISIKKALNPKNECVRWIEAFRANPGHPLWGSHSMQELASGMRNFLPFLISPSLKRNMSGTWLSRSSYGVHVAVTGSTSHPFFWQTYLCVALASQIFTWRFDSGFRLWCSVQ